MDWDDIIAYMPLIRKKAIARIKEIKKQDSAVDVDDVVMECVIHCYNHRDRYDPERGGVGTFIRLKTNQQLFKILSKLNNANNARQKYICEHYLTVHDVNELENKNPEDFYTGDYIENQE
jgi:DNA-directed RNA polymerase specialized sigma24 family protein